MSWRIRSWTRVSSRPPRRQDTRARHTKPNSPARWPSDRRLVQGEEVAEDYQVPGLPTFYVIGQDGKVLHTSVGYDEGAEEHISQVIDKALSAKEAGPKDPKSGK